LPGPILRTLLS
jgi:hypothetical protein